MLPSESSPFVFLVHGLLRTGASMAPLGAALVRYGFRSSLITQLNLHRDIPALGDHLFDHVRRVRDRHEERTGQRPPAHFVTHSLGGIVLRSMLSRYEVDGPNRCVLLAPPNQGSRLAEHMNDRLRLPWGSFDPLGKLLPGERGQCADAGDPDATIGIIIGTGSSGFGPPWRTLGGGFEVAGEGEHDGTVGADETRLDSAVDSIRVPFAHSLMMFRPSVIRATADFLRHGRFTRS